MNEDAEDAFAIRAFSRSSELLLDDIGNGIISSFSVMITVAGKERQDKLSVNAEEYTLDYSIAYYRTELESFTMPQEILPVLRGQVKRMTFLL